MTPIKYENAELNIQVLRNELQQAGLLDSARCLDGIELTCKHTVLGAIEVVKGLQLMAAPKAVIDSYRWTLKHLSSAAQA